MLVECERPSLGKSLVGSARNIARDPHANAAISAQINQIQRCSWLDQHVATRTQFVFSNQVVANNPVSPIAQYRLKKADLQRLAQIKDTETVLWHPAARITEAASRLPVAERVGIPGGADMAECLSWLDRRDMERRMCEWRASDCDATFMQRPAPRSPLPPRLR